MWNIISTKTSEWERFLILFVTNSGWSWLNFSILDKKQDTKIFTEPIYTTKHWHKIMG